MGRLEGKVALITGASSGLGKAIAQRFAAEGAQVVAADINARSASADSSSAHVTAVQCDVTSPDQIQSMFAECKRRFGRLDILVNNAGIGRGGPRIHDIPLEDWDRVIEVNLRGVFLVLKYGLPLMMASGGGSIINTASTSGFKAVVGNGAYTPSKAAVVLLTRMAALEYAGDNIRVNCICPGPIDTPIYDNVPAETRASIMKALPMGRMGKPSEVANLVLFLASDEASFITGSAYAIDGGRLVA